MNTEQTTAKRHGPSRVTTVICLALILCAALVIARMVKFRSQVDVTLPAVLWEDGETTAVNTTLHFHGELVKQWGQDDKMCIRDSRLHVAHRLGRPGGHRLSVRVPAGKVHVLHRQDAVQDCGRLIERDGVVPLEGHALRRGDALDLSLIHISATQP